MVIYVRVDGQPPRRISAFCCLFWLVNGLDLGFAGSTSEIKTGSWNLF